jgi:hypothetical protein
MPACRIKWLRRRILAIPVDIAAPPALRMSQLNLSMKAYLITTGTIFALITIAHICRVFAEGSHVLNPFFIALTLLAAGLGCWAFRLLMRPSR